MTTESQDLEWVPSACTLPRPERPLRVAEFDALFAAAIRRVDRPAPHRLQLTLTDAPGRRATVEELTARETACCSVFTFTLTAVGGDLVLDVEVPTPQTAVLDALADRATTALS